jgi:LPXTG-site transpeptidase (sortase) family protein
MMKKKKKVALLFVFIALIAVIILFLQTNNSDWMSIYLQDTPVITPTLVSDDVKVTTDTTDAPSSSDEGETSPVIETKENEKISDELIITVERQNYENGALTLIIPKLDFTEKVENGTEKDDLRRGPGLYDYAQLPGEGDRNVSIAAHRNTNRNGVIGEWYFYYIDTLTTGDYLYLVDKDHIYQYEYDQTVIVDAYDWTPIYRQGFSCLTLTSCEPIGISTHRIIVRSRLVTIFPYTPDFHYE